MDTPIDSDLALFCPACPQVNINIPPKTKWKTEDWCNITLLHIESECDTDITQITLPSTASCGWQYEIGPSQYETS